MPAKTYTDKDEKKRRVEKHLEEYPIKQSQKNLATQFTKRAYTSKDVIYSHIAGEKFEIVEIILHVGDIEIDSDEVVYLVYEVARKEMPIKLMTPAKKGLTVLKESIKVPAHTLAKIYFQGEENFTISDIHVSVVTKN